MDVQLLVKGPNQLITELIAEVDGFERWHEGATRGAGSVVLEVIGHAASAIGVLQGPSTIKDVVRTLRRWRRDQPSKQAVEVVVVDARTERSVHLSLPKNSDLDEVAELLRVALES